MTPKTGNLMLAARHRVLLEHHRLVPIQQHAVFDVPADGAGEHNFFKIAAFLNEIIHRVAVGDARNVLLDNRAIVEHGGHVVAPTKAGRNEWWMLMIFCG